MYIELRVRNSQRINFIKKMKVYVAKAEVNELKKERIETVVVPQSLKEDHLRVPNGLLTTE